MNNIIVMLNNLKEYFMNIENKIVRRHRKTTIRDIFHVMSISQALDLSIDSSISHINLKYKKNVCTKRSYLDRLDKIDADIFKENISHLLLLINNIKNKNHIIKELNKSNNEHSKKLAVDGTYAYMSEKIKFEPGDKTFNYSQNGCCLKVLISAIYDIENKMPIDYTLGNKDERKLLESQINNNIIEKGDMIIHDRGYYSAKLLNEYKNKGIDCLFRMKKCNNLCKKLNKDNISDDTYVVYKQQKIPVRVMYYEIEDSKEKGYYLLTNNLSKQITVDDYKNMYKERWEIETHFLQVKNNTKFVGTNMKTFKNYMKNILINNYIFILSSYIINELTNEYLYWDNKYNKKIITKIIADDLLDVIFNSPKDEQIKEEDICFIINEIKKYVIQPRSKPITYPRMKKKPCSKWTTSGSKTGNSQQKKIVTKTKANNTAKKGKNTTTGNKTGNLQQKKIATKIKTNNTIRKRKNTTTGNKNGNLQQNKITTKIKTKNTIRKGKNITNNVYPIENGIINVDKYLKNKKTNLGNNATVKNNINCINNKIQIINNIPTKSKI